MTSESFANSESSCSFVVVRELHPNSSDAFVKKTNTQGGADE
jgi:hypothetical protein